PRGPRDQCPVPHADLLLGVEPPLPHVRLPPGGPAPRRRRGAPRAPRRGPRARDPGGARRGVQPHGPRLLGVPPRAGERSAVAVPRLVPLLVVGARRAAPVPPLP